MTKEECIADLKSINATGMECIDYAIKALEQQSDDCVSKAELMKLYYEYQPTLATNVYEFGEKLKALPPVTPTRKVGKWIYDKASQNWRCSECNETPKTMGYVGTADFMAEHFRFCNHCGIEMVGAENE